MADVITRFKLETSQFDSKLRDTAKALQGIAHQASLGGKDFNDFNQKAIESARALGTVQSGATNTKDKLRDLVGSYNDAAKAYNSLTETAKKGEFGQAMSQSLTQLQQRIRETKEELYGLGDGMKGASGGSLFSSDKLSGMLQVFGGNLMTKGAGMALSFAGELKDMVAQGIELAKAGEGVRLAFQRLGRGDILDGLREATHGTVTDLELMKAAVKFNDFKLPLDELGTMLAFAQQKAKDTGQSVDYMVDSIVTGLGRKSLMILDNLGLSAAEVKEKMAETGDMTKAVGAIIREQMSKAGDYVETAADRATQANVELENAMTRLGETFQPLTDSATSMWTDIKVGALDLLNNAIKPLIDKFTELGRMRAVYEGQSGDVRVNRQLDRLKGIQTDSYRQGTYKAQLRNYDTQIASHEQYLKDYKAWQSDKTNVGAYDRMQKFKQQTGLEWVSDVQAHLDAFKKMRSEYVQGAKAILEGNPVPSPTSTTTNTPTGTTTTTTTHQTPQQRAQESFTKAEQNYKQALEQAAMELEAGTITRAEAKKKEMQAAEQRWKAIGDARNISDSENLRKAQDEAAANYKALAAEVKTITEHQKALDKATRDLENANQKLATARTEMAQAKQQGDLQAYNTAKNKATAAQKEITRLEKVKVDVETGTVNLPDIPTEMTTTVDFQANTRNIDAAISYVKKEMDTIPIGTIEFNLDQTKLADLTTLKTLISEQMKNGLQIDPNFAQSMFSNILAGKDIENTTWQAQVDNINKNLTANRRDPLKIDYETGEKENGKEDKETKKLTDKLSTLTSGLSSIAGGLKSMGINLPAEVDQVIGVIQGVTSVIEGVNAVISIFSTSSMAANTIALSANTAALWAVAATSFFPFANGGVVHAANGYVDGNTYSGDKIPALLNAGELVLNRAQQGNLASQLEGGVGAMQLSAIITGEQLRLVLNNNGRRTGRGEYVTTNFR